MGKWRQFRSGAIVETYEPMDLRIAAYGFDIYTLGVS